MTRATIVIFFLEKYIEKGHGMVIAAVNKAATKPWMEQNYLSANLIPFRRKR